METAALVARPPSSRHAQRIVSRYGPWAVVTGASDGIGRAIATRLAACGVHLVLVARRGAVLEAIAGELDDAYGVSVETLALDLATEDALETLASATASIDVGLLVASAGFGTSGPFLEADLERELNMLQVNCAALLGASLVFGRRFAARGRGGIVLLSSLVGFQGVPRAAHYAATKAYVQTLAEGLHLELGPAHVDVLASAPGPVHTGFADRADMRMHNAVSADDVARDTLEALGRRMTVRPGLLSKILEGSLAPLPRALRARILARVMHGMTQHQEQHAWSAPMPEREPLFVVVTRAQVRSLSVLPAFVRLSARCVEDARQRSGCVGAHIKVTRPLRWHTLTGWRDAAAMLEFVHDTVHAEAMREAAALTTQNRFLRFETSLAWHELDWRFALEQLARAGRDVTP